MFRQRTCMNFRQRLSCASRWSQACPTRLLLHTSLTWFACGCQEAAESPMHTHARSQPRCQRTIVAALEELMIYCWCV